MVLRQVASDGVRAGGIGNTFGPKGLGSDCKVLSSSVRARGQALRTEWAEEPPTDIKDTEHAVG